MLPGEAGGGHDAVPPGRPRTARLRRPLPLLKWRIPSGRGATEQPNATGDGNAPLNGPFWLGIVLTGVAAGLFGAAMMALLFSVQHLAFNYSSGPVEQAVERAGDLRRLTSLLVAGVIGGTSWYLLRRYTKGEKSEVDDAIWRGDARLSFRRCLGTGVISEIVIGMGASIGREQAPKLMGAASGSVLSRWLGLSDGQRKLLVACGAGAGLAAVYNVPLVLPALACAFIATTTAWIYLPTGPTYLDIPAYHLSATLMVWSVLVGPILGVVAAAYTRLIGWVSYRRTTGAMTAPAMVVAFGALGLIGFEYPQLFGNGKDVAHDAFLGQGSLTLLLALCCLKPLVTAMCLKSGAAGGLFTPTLSTGALLGAFLGLAWSHLWAGAPIGAFAMVAAAAMTGAAMQAPLAGLALVLELTHTGFALVVPMMAATVTATFVARAVDGYSIYSARLPAES
jgi:H+/Cl- antiporter ClcA